MTSVFCFSHWRIRLRRIIYLILLLIPLLQVRAETAALTLEDAIRLALDSSINIKKSSVDLASTEYSSKRLWAEIFPGFSVNAGFTYLPSTPLFTDPGFRYRDEALSYSFNFGVSLSLNPSLSPAMKRIELAYRSQLLSYENARKQLEIQVAKSFFGLKNSKEYLSHMEDSLEVAQHKLNNDRVARNNGQISELTWLNSQLSAETARYNLSSARSSYERAQYEFLALIGMETESEIILEGKMEIARMLHEPEALIAEHLQKRPDIIGQRQTIERLELAKSQTALSSRSPSLDISAQWRGNPSSSGGGLSDPFTDNVSGSLTLRIPVDSWIPGTKQNQTIRSANSEVEKAKLDLQNTETQAKSQIRALVFNLDNTWENLEIANLRAQLAQRTAEATEVAFRNGVVSFQELEDRRNDFSDAKQRVLQGELTYQSLILDLAAALNVDWKTLIRSGP